jgi:hypothetical protein
MEPIDTPNLGAHNMARALGTDDSINTCDCCGKSNLKFTVIIEQDSGEIVHYGQVCAGRNTGKSRPQINAEIKSHKAAQENAARQAWRTHPAYLAERARFAERSSAGVMPGRAAMEFVREAVEAADIARNALAQQFGVSTYALM